jgi:SAM-dependent methyltransferase
MAERETAQSPEQAASESATHTATESATPQSTGCCGPATAQPATPEGSIALTSEDDVRKLVRDKYGQIARESSSCCGDSVRVDDMQKLGYSGAQSQDVPEGANLGLGCGNPLAHADVRVGETVLDLGSGAGIDAFLAAREVGPTGHVIGVDMTPDMIERARANAQRTDVEHVEFRLGEIERLPVDENSVDLVISNCVINLSPDKPRVFGEAFRVLRPGGRLVVSDLTLLRPLPESVKQSVEAYVGCVAGASLKDDYLQYIRDSGFADVEIAEERRYPADASCVPADVADASELVVSVKVRARKP